MTGLGLKYSLAEKLLLGKIHSKLGLDRCLSGMYSGAAPLNPETIEFLKSLGIVVSELYGMTEIPNHTANIYDPEERGAKIRIGSVGQSAPGTQTRLHLKVYNIHSSETLINSRMRASYVQHLPCSCHVRHFLVSVKVVNK